MRYGSVCSGVEAATVAWHPLGWRPQWFAEIEPFPSRVLNHHYADVPNLGDMTTLHEKKEYRNSDIDVLVGGTPCQSFSIAGLRKGLDDPRGNLALHFLKLCDEKRPKWVVWENVPGVLSSWSDAETCEDGSRWQSNDFDTFLCGFRELGYGIAWRILDAQYFGVAQRRRRVFVVGCLGDPRGAAAVLFEQESLRGNPAPSREQRQGIARGADAGLNHGGTWWNGEQVTQTLTKSNANGAQRMPDKDHFGAVLIPITLSFDTYNQGENALYAPMVSQENVMRTLEARGPHLVLPFDTTQITSPINGSVPKTGDPCHPLVAGGHPPAVVIYGSQDPVHSTEIGQPVGTNNGLENVLFETVTIGDGADTLVANANQLTGREGEICAEISVNPSQIFHRVRRLTPRECERLQGFPDDYTLIPGASDGARYKAMGNSMAVPVMAWIGRRIELVNQLLQHANS